MVTSNGPFPDIVLPKDLSGLSEPWQLTSREARYEAVEALPLSRETILDALSTFELCLSVASELPELPLEPIAGLLEGWSFVKDELTRQMPRLKYFHRDRFIQLLREYGEDVQRPGLVEALAFLWLQTVLSAIAREALNSLEEHRDLLRIHEEVPRTLATIERVWRKADRGLKETVVGALAVIGGSMALPVLSRIESDPIAEDDLRSSARNYINFVQVSSSKDRMED